jgi:hypothetical protein
MDDQEAVFVPLVGRHERGPKMREWIAKPSGPCLPGHSDVEGSLQVDRPDHAALAKYILRTPECARVSYLNDDCLISGAAGERLQQGQSFSARIALKPNATRTMTSVGMPQIG